MDVQESSSVCVVKPIYFQVLVHSLEEVASTSSAADEVVDSSRKVVLQDVLPLNA